MSTSDENSQAPLTRKQLREIRLTGSLPVISEAEAAAASEPTTVLPRAAEPIEIAPAVSAEKLEPNAPLTRRQRRALQGADDEAPASSGSDEHLVPGIAEFDPIYASAPRFEVAEVHAADMANDAEPEPLWDRASERVAAPEERPMVGAASGVGVKADSEHDALVDEPVGGDATSTQRGSSTALIFTPAPGAGSLSGPIASTGELLITGTYSLPEGVGSQGHAHGFTDGKDIDAVLMDGELPPSSSPTPVAASSAVSTSKTAGEVIRPPGPDKGNRLMFALAVVAGGLAIVLATTIILAFTTGVFG